MQPPYRRPVVAVVRRWLKVMFLGHDCHPVFFLKQIAAESVYSYDEKALRLPSSRTRSAFRLIHRSARRPIQPDSKLPLYLLGPCAHAAARLFRGTASALLRPTPSRLLWGAASSAPRPLLHRVPLSLSAL